MDRLYETVERLTETVAKLSAIVREQAGVIGQLQALLDTESEGYNNGD